MGSRSQSRCLALFFTVVLCVLCICTEGLSQQISSFSETNSIETNSPHYHIVHYYDYTWRTSNERRKLLFFYGEQNIFYDSLNRYSYILIMNSSTGDTILRKACPALSSLYVTSDEKYIIGLSDVKQLNPYDLIIMDIKGRPIFKRSVYRPKLKMNTNELRQFVSKFPGQFIQIVNNNQICKIDNWWYLNPDFNQIYRDSEFKDYISSYYYFSDPVFKLLDLNRTFYSINNPQVRVHEIDGSFKSITLNDHMEIPRTIDISNHNFTINYFIKNGFLINKTYYIYKDFVIKKDSNLLLKDSFFYVRWGNLDEYYSDWSRFTSQNKLNCINSNSSHNNLNILSYTLIAFSDSSQFTFHGDRGQLSNEQINQLKMLKGINRVSFEDIELSNSEGQIRKIPGFRYTILK